MFPIRLSFKIANGPLGIVTYTDIYETLLYGGIPVVEFGTSRNADAVNRLLLRHCLGIYTIASWIIFLKV